MSSTEILRLSEFSDTTPVLIPTVEQPIEMSVADVLRWVAPTAPPGEALKFLMACRMAQVNPFLGEAHLVDHGGRFTTIIDKSGYLKRAQAHPAYEGHEAGIIAQTLDPRTQARGPLLDLPGSFLPPGHVVVGGWAKVYRKGVRKPIELRVSIQEYNRGTATWKSLTCTMIRKVALVQALRESGLISTGWYTDAEVGPTRATYDDPGEFDQATHQAIDVEYSHAVDSAADPDLLARVVELVNESGMTSGQLQSALHRRGVSRLAELSNVQLNELIVKLSAKVRYDDPLKGVMPGLVDSGFSGEVVEIKAEGSAANAPTANAPTAGALPSPESDHADAHVDATVDVTPEPIANEA